MFRLNWITQPERIAGAERRAGEKWARTLKWK
jgi:hypothetical protein